MEQRPDGFREDRAPAERVVATVDLRSHELGVEPPPQTAHIKIFPRKDGWRLVVWVPDGSPDAVNEWVSTLGPVDRIGGTTSQRLVSTLDAQDLPARMVQLLEIISLEHLVAYPSGRVTVRARGSREAFQAVLGGIESFDGLRRISSVQGQEGEGSERAASPLTAHQEQILAYAEAAGYYEIPRKVTLRELADQLDASSSAVSGTLRRAELCLVRNYLHDPDQRAAAGFGSSD